MTISSNTQELVRKRTEYRCEYCHYPEFLSSSPLTIDHVNYSEAADVFNDMYDSYAEGG